MGCGKHKPVQKSAFPITVSFESDERTTKKRDKKRASLTEKINEQIIAQFDNVLWSVSSS